MARVQPLWAGPTPASLPLARPPPHPNARRTVFQSRQPRRARRARQRAPSIDAPPPGRPPRVEPGSLVASIRRPPAQEAQPRSTPQADPARPKRRTPEEEPDARLPPDRRTQTTPQRAIPRPAHPKRRRQEARLNSRRPDHRGQTSPQARAIPRARLAQPARRAPEAEPDARLLPDQRSRWRQTGPGARMARAQMTPQAPAIPQALTIPPVRSVKQEPQVPCVRWVPSD